ncbi:MAG TPA: 2-oxoglutarate dehydrogenase complex dihydrolipoyllysine-residue succinyltransferase [Chthoniobacterales bacterium]|jgi:2-oxoglutarate dehydrogenase E2 component (dihydrolipoamide succinyltransferase)
MSVEVKIPAVGESISSGVVSVWHKKSGEFVQAGEALFTLETDKVSTEITAEKAGLLETLVPEGREVKIGELVATIDDSKSAPAAVAAPKAVGAGGGGPGSPSPATILSPAVRRVVEEAGINPAGLTGTGKGGRLTKADVVAAAQDRKSAGESLALSEAERAASLPSPATEDRSVADGTAGRFTRRKMSPLRRKIAAQLVMAQHTAAILTTFNECDMTAVQELRAKEQEAFTRKNGFKLGFMSFFVKAAVAALKAVPAINSRIEDDDMIENHFYDIGVAVGTERGLVVPIVRDADRKTFAELEQDIAGFAAKAREGKLKIEELQGGTFTVSNGGVYGSLLSTPILNPPQTGILGMHKIMPRPVAVEGKVEIRPMMYLALSYDHRAVDGKEAVTFLIKVKEGIEQPQTLPLDF